MTNHGMLVCSFRLKYRRHKSEDALYLLNQPYILDQDGDTITIDDTVEMFRLFCEANTNLSDDIKKKKVFSVKENSFHKDETSTYSAVSFIIKSGSYGIEADITDKNTHEVKYHRGVNDSDVKEFLCVVYIPKDVGAVKIKKGILVFQSIGTYGVKTITTERMRVFFSNMKLTLETRSVSVAAFLEKLIEQGDLQKLTLIRNQMSLNPADNMLISTGREEQTFIKPKFHQAWLNQMLSIFHKADETGVVEIPEGESYDDISVQFKLGDRVRTVRLRNLEKLSIVEDIPDHIMESKDSTKIVQYMINTADAYKNRMVWGDPSEV